MFKYHVDCWSSVCVLSSDQSTTDLQLAGNTVYLALHGLQHLRHVENDRPEWLDAGQQHSRTRVDQLHVT